MDKHKELQEKLIRLKKAEKFMDDVTIPLEKKEPHIESLKQLFKDINKLIKEINYED